MEFQTEEMIVKNMMVMMLVFAGSLSVFAEVAFQDTFDGAGALGAGWNTWKNTSSAANPIQSGGSFVFDRTSTAWAQAAVQTTTTVDVGAYDSVEFRFGINDFGGDSVGLGIPGKTSFVVSQYDTSLNSLYGSSGVDGLVFSVEHQSINFGSFPDAETDPRTNIKVYTIAGVELGALVVRATNDYTMVVTMTDSTWAFDAEGVSWWKKSGKYS